MVFNSYSLDGNKARICRGAGAIFLTLAACSASAIVIAAFMPEAIGLVKAMGGDVTSTQVDLLWVEDRAQVNASPATRQAFEDYLTRPLVRLGAAGVAVVGWLPFAMLMLGIGQALRRFGGGDADPLARALPWLRRASIAAIVWALAVPLSDSLMLMLIYPGTPAGPHWMITLVFVRIGTALLLAIAAYATVWALEAGVRAQRDLAEIV